jgi:hypothetical protein
MKEIGDKLQKDHWMLKICDICEPAKLGTLSNPHITFFSIPVQEYEILPYVRSLQESVIFSKQWDKYCHKLQINIDKIQIDYIPTKVWEPASTECKNILTKIMAGNITFDEVEENFKHFKNDYEKMIKEVCKLHSGLNGNIMEFENMVIKRISQIEVYHLLESYKDAAQTIHNIKEKFHLIGDFSVLDTLMKSVSVLYYVKENMRIITLRQRGLCMFIFKPLT